jgi:hypothetical protein
MRVHAHPWTRVSFSGIYISPELSRLQHSLNV